MTSERGAPCLEIPRWHTDTLEKALGCEDNQAVETGWRTAPFQTLPHFFL